MLFHIIKSSLGFLITHMFIERPWNPKVCELWLHFLFLSYLAINNRKPIILIWNTKKINRFEDSLIYPCSSVLVQAPPWVFLRMACLFSQVLRSHGPHFSPVPLCRVWRWKCFKASSASKIFKSFDEENICNIYVSMK